MKTSRTSNRGAFGALAVAGVLALSGLATLGLPGTAVAAPGDLTFAGVIKDGDGGTVDGLAGTYSVVVSPDGKNAYAAGYDDNAIAVFTRNPATGALSFVTVLRDGEGGVDGIDGAYILAISPDGKNVYVLGYDEIGLATFTRDATTGALTYAGVLTDGVGGVHGLEYTNDVVVSPDGKNVYVASDDHDTLAVFNRNGTTGALTYSTLHEDGVDGVDGLDSVYGVTVSPDGKNVYTAAGDGDNAVAVFNRDTNTGALTYVTVINDGDSGIDGLAGAYDLVLSADGKNLYVASLNDNAVAVFTRNTTTGALTYVTAIKDGIGGVDGLTGAESVALSPDGTSLYTTGYAALSVFKRNTTTGALTYSTVFKNDVGGVDGLQNGYLSGVSPDGKNVYVASQSDNTIATFSREVPPPPPAVLQRCNGVPATIVGNDGPNTIVGTTHRDVIVALGGNDVIRGRGGNDLICGGRGKDRLSGGPGNDTLIGGNGSDTLKGNKGRDHLKGGKGRDTLIGGPGPDHLTGGPDRDVERS